MKKFGCLKIGFISIALFIGVSVLISIYELATAEDRYFKEKESIHAEIKNLSESGNHDEALYIYNQYKKYGGEELKVIASESVAWKAEQSKIEEEERKAREEMAAAAKKQKQEQDAAKLVEQYSLDVDYSTPTRHDQKVSFLKEQLKESGVRGLENFKITIGEGFTCIDISPDLVKQDDVTAFTQAIKIFSTLSKFTNSGEIQLIYRFSYLDEFAQESRVIHFKFYLPLEIIKKTKWKNVEYRYDVFKKLVKNHGLFYERS